MSHKHLRSSLPNRRSVSNRRNKRIQPNGFRYETLESRRLLASLYADVSHVSETQTVTLLGGESLDMSRDGRYVAFSSDKPDLVVGDTNSTYDVFVADTQLGTITRVSTDSSGAEGNGRSLKPNISHDGRFVAFQSDASNFAGAINNTNQIYLKDLNTGTTTLVSPSASVSTIGANSSSFDPSISNDGRFVTFSSRATDLIAGDSNNLQDVFLHDTQTSITTLISTHLDGTQLGSASYLADISGDGNYAVFETDSQIVVADTNVLQRDVYRKDLLTGDMVLVSVNSDGVQSDVASVGRGSISDNGQWVAFESYGSTLVPGDNNTYDVFVKDLDTGELVRASINFDGSDSDGQSQNPRLSGNGRFVAFDSYATELIELGSNDRPDAYVHDLTTGETILVSATALGAPANAISVKPTVISDGTVAFFSAANNLSTDDADFQWDIFSASLLPVSSNDPTISVETDDSNQASVEANKLWLTPSGTLSVEDIDIAESIQPYVRSVKTLGNDDSYTPSDLLTLLTVDSGPVIGGTATTGLINWQFDAGTTTFDHLAMGESLQLIYLLVASDMKGGFDTHEVTITIEGSGIQSREVQLVSFAESGGQLGTYDRVTTNTVSRDGRFVAFSTNNYSNGSVNDGLFIRDMDSLLVTRIGFDENGNSIRAWDGDFSDDGRHIVFTGVANTIYIRDLETNISQVVSTNIDGTTGFGQDPKVSGDGRYVTFSSSSSTLVADDTNGEEDIFVKDMLTGDTTRVSIDINDLQSTDDSFHPTISNDGRYVAFESKAELDPTEFGNYDIYIRDLIEGTTTLVSQGLSPYDANGDSRYPSLSGNGKYLVFQSEAWNLVEGDDNESWDIFVTELETGVTSAVSSSHGGSWADHGSIGGSISNDGTYIGFESLATNIVVGDTNAKKDIFLHNRLTGLTTRMSTNSVGGNINQDAYSSNVSGDGSSIVFITTAWNLVGNDTNGLESISNFPYGIDSYHVKLSDTFLLGELGLGVAANDNASGAGFLLFSLDNVHERFDDIYEGHAEHLIAVRQNGEQWQYTQQEGTTIWRDFVPADTDRLIAQIDFDIKTINELIGFDTVFGGISAGYSNGDLTFLPNSWGSTYNFGEFQVLGTQFSVGSRLNVGWLGLGVAANDDASGTGFLLHSNEMVHSRFDDIYSDNADHFVAVRYHQNQWQYTQRETGTGWTDFTPVGSDRLVAQIDFDKDTVVSLKGVSALFNGIHAGYVDGDLEFAANQWGGSGNDGEFEVTGTYFEGHPTIGQTSSSTLLGRLGDGVAAQDDFTGTGYLLYSKDNVHDRFGLVYSGNADHLMVVRLNAGQWQFTNLEGYGWLDFTPVDSDRLLADINFENDTIKGMLELQTAIGGVDAGYTSGDLIFYANRWGGLGNTGEFGVTGTFFDTGGSVIRRPVGDLGFGIAADDDATGAGYLMYSDEDIHTRFSNVETDNADHLIVVRHSGVEWEYTNVEDGGWTSFIPRESDRLIADIDFGLDTVVGLEDVESTFEGIGMGYSESDLEFFPNQWNGSSNVGEFEVAGTYFKTGASIKNFQLGELGLGISALDSAAETGYLLYSVQSVHERLNFVYSVNSDHLIAVRLNNTQWQYTNVEGGIGWTNFTPVATDRIIADIDFALDTIDGMQGIDTLIEGVNAGYLNSDITFNADQWNGGFNNGEFEVEGTFFEIA